MNDYKNIIALFLKVDPSRIEAHTIIDKSVVHGSIMLQRMQTKLAQAGCRVDNWRDIRSYGDLERALSGQDSAECCAADAPPGHGEAKAKPRIDMMKSAIGVDIEEIANMPLADDYREESFYRETFTPGEISYCILQSDPRESFAGLFSAKEAVFKAGGRKFNALREIEIVHDGDGRPCTSGYELSISHSGFYAVAVALRLPSADDSRWSLLQQDDTTGQRQERGNSIGTPESAWLQYVAVIVSLVALAMVLLHHVA